MLAIDRVLDSSRREFFANYTPKNRIRFVTATSLFDGHDASINMIRRLLQARGAEVIHLGHNRSVAEVVKAALEEDAHCIGLSSYQGGHMEYFRYLRTLLTQNQAENVQIFGGGGGVLTLEEIDLLAQEGVAKIYSPEDGQKLGLEGMIGHILKSGDFSLGESALKSSTKERQLARALSILDNNAIPENNFEDFLKSLGTKPNSQKTPIIGITGTGGAGKSSLLDELLLRFLLDTPSLKIGVLCIDPTKRKTGGALLGDRIRLNSASREQIYMRSLASHDSNKETSRISQKALSVMKQFEFDFIVYETSGIGQGDSSIVDLSDECLYVMTPEYGASSQLEKINMLDYATWVAINKYERSQGPDAFKHVQTLIRRNRYRGKHQSNQDYKVYGTVASRFGDDGCEELYLAIRKTLQEKYQLQKLQKEHPERPHQYTSTQRNALIPSHRQNYLAQISQEVRIYHKKNNQIKSLIQKWQASTLLKKDTEDQNLKTQLEKKQLEYESQIPPHTLEELENWPETVKKYYQQEFHYQVRGRKLSVSSSFSTLSGLNIPRVIPPTTDDLGEVFHYLTRENLPGSFPYTSGLFPFRRQMEDPTRMFAGEGGPDRTNKRFHYLSEGQPATRLSTAFDSVTLYGADPAKRPDIYGKVGNAGVSIAHLDDMKNLYKGFDLCAATTSVSKTINGPAPIILAMFLNTAIDQQIDKFCAKNSRQPTPDEWQKIKAETLNKVRGTVQADILKEDQAQNTCIFSTEFALKMMGDMQEYFIDENVRNYYGVSISGYHIAEAGANPITQTAFTLANGFTYVEYYLARGFPIDSFAQNLSFFFSNGVDAEYAVIGRVARRIWAIAMRNLYQANEKSQKLKYHIQTSGRSLHAQEMAFNDIRTTLQALLAIYDNCNSLHTNAYDEAITTPTEESVRRAMAIQLIINKEFGPNYCENVNQGSYYINLLTDLVEEAVLKEFDRISERGGVLGAMETQYQRSKIQEESLHYEEAKHSGSLPIIGVNTFLAKETEDLGRVETDLMRSTDEEKDEQLARLDKFQTSHANSKQQALKRLRSAASTHKNIFKELMETVRHASLGEISNCLYEVGGQYRRSM